MSMQGNWEYYLIQMVSQDSYDLCIIGDTKKANPILNCSNPEQRKAFTLLIFEFQPIPGIPDFQAGNSYYFISTSHGTLYTLNNQFEGVCKSHHMKMVLKVLPKSTDTNKGNTNVNTGSQDTVTTKPTSATTTTTTTTTTFTTTTTTTSATTTSSTNRRTQTVKENEDLIPGSEGFPSDDTVIKSRDNPNINSGIIADAGKIENSAPCLSCHSISSLVSCIAFSVLLTLTLLAC
uniref:Ephrin RBD domain-containing protein n=1 Tax=Biomphalaria glabrata TaxID=6526 RepID=A0A2C9JDR5_BIOGL